MTLSIIRLKRKHWLVYGDDDTLHDAKHAADEYKSVREMLSTKSVTAAGDEDGVLEGVLELEEVRECVSIQDLTEAIQLVSRDINAPVAGMDQWFFPKAKCRSGHPEKHLFSLSKKNISWIKVSKKIVHLILKIQALACGRASVLLI